MGRPQKTVYITGTTGLVGYELCHHFSNIAKYSTVAVFRNNPAIEFPLECSQKKTADIFEADWFQPQDTQAAIIHCAGLANPRLDIKDFFRFADEHILPHLQMLENLVANGWRGRLIYPSSGGTIYGDTIELPIQESHPTLPKSFYGLQKLLLENAFSHLAQKHEFELVILRISNPYGGRIQKRDQGIIPLLIEAIATGRPLPIFGDGSSIRDYIHVDDMCRAFEAAARVPMFMSPVTMNIGSGQGIATNTLVEMLESLLGKKLQRERWPVTFDVHSNVLSNKLAQQMLSWRPEVTLDAGLKALISESNIAHSFY